MLIFAAACGGRTALEVDDAGPPSRLSDVSGISVGYRTSCVVDTAGCVSCWGSNRSGQLGNRDLAPLGIEYVPTPAPVLFPGVENTGQLAIGAGHVCTRQIVGAVACWGYNSSGQLGNGFTFPPYPEPGTPAADGALISDVTQVVAGDAHSCALRLDGRVTCWGNGRHGQTGSLVDAQPLPREVDAVDSVLELAAGSQHVCALQSDGQVMCWGNQDPLRASDRDDSGTPIPEPVALSTDVLTIGAGGYSTCALGIEGDIWCWGKWRSGPIEPEPFHVHTAPGAELLAVGHMRGCVVDGTGGVICWAGSTAPASVPGLSYVVGIGVGSTHACALRTSGEVLCWGGNQSGELGRGTVGLPEERPAPVVGL